MACVVAGREPAGSGRKEKENKISVTRRPTCTTYHGHMQVQQPYYRRLGGGNALDDRRGMGQSSAMPDAPCVEQTKKSLRLLVCLVR